MRTNSLGLRFLRVVYVIKTWLLYKFHMLRFYNLITIKKINCYCKKTSKSKINLKINSFYKHIAILYVIMVAQHHTKVVEPHFTFLHLHKNYNLFKTIYQAINKLNQSYYIQWPWIFYHSTHIASVAYHKNFIAIGGPQL